MQKRKKGGITQDDKDGQKIERLKKERKERDREINRQKRVN